MPRTMSRSHIDAEAELLRDAFVTSTGMLNRALPEGARSCRRSPASALERLSGAKLRTPTGAAASNGGAMLSPNRTRRNLDGGAGELHERKAG